MGRQRLIRNTSTKSIDWIQTRNDHDWLFHLQIFYNYEMRSEWMHPSLQVGMKQHVLYRVFTSYPHIWMWDQTNYTQQNASGKHVWFGGRGNLLLPIVWVSKEAHHSNHASISILHKLRLRTSFRPHKMVWSHLVIVGHETLVADK